MKRFTTTLLIAISVIFSSFLWGCHDSENPSGENVSLQLKQNELKIPASGGEFSVEYTLNGAMEGTLPSVNGTPEWIQDLEVDNGILSFTASINENKDQRNASLIIKYQEIADTLSVIQEGIEEEVNPESPFRVEIPEELITEMSATFNVYPTDQNINFMSMSMERKTAESMGGDENIFNALIEYIKSQAASYGMNLSEFMATNDLLHNGDLENEVLMALIPDNDYFVLTVGLEFGENDSAKMSTEMVKTPFRTKAVEMVDMNFEFSFEINGTDVEMGIVPTLKDHYYYFDLIPKPALDAAGLTLEEFSYQALALQIGFGTSYGMTPEEIIKQLCVTGDYYENYYDLDGNTEYVGYAYGCSLKGLIDTQIAQEIITTGSVPKSDNVITIEIGEPGVDQIEIHTTTTNDDPYVIVAEKTSELTGMNDEEIMEYMCQYDLYENSYNGNIDGTLYALAPDTEYMVMAFGYRSGQSTTALTKAIFKTLEGGNPDVFQFSSKAEDITSSSANVTVQGTPESVLYYWDLYEAGMSDNEILAEVNAMIEEYIAYEVVEDRLDFARQYGIRGTESYEFKQLKGSTEYQPFALAVNESTGEFTGGVFRGEKFTTETPQESEITIKVVYDKYWDADEVAAKYEGYDEMTNQNLCCLPVFVETTGAVATTMFQILPDDYTDRQDYTDQQMIDEFIAYGDGNTKSADEYFLEYGYDYTILAIAQDAEGRYSSSFRELVNFSKDGISDIADFKPLGQSATATGMASEKMSEARKSNLTVIPNSRQARELKWCYRDIELNR